MGLPYGGTFSAVGGFMFLGGSYFCGSGKPKYGGTFSAVMQYGGIFLAVGGFSFSSGSGFGGGGKPKYGGIFSAVMQYGCNCLAVSGLSFLGSNVDVNSKLGGNCGARLTYSYVFGARPNGKPISDGYPYTCTYPWNCWFVRRFQARSRGKTNRLNCGYLSS